MEWFEVDTPTLVKLFIAYYLFQRLTVEPGPKPMGAGGGGRVCAMMYVIFYKTEQTKYNKTRCKIDEYDPLSVGLNQI